MKFIILAIIVIVSAAGYFAVERQGKTANVLQPFLELQKSYTP